MKIACQKADLGQAVSIASRAISPRSTLPILGNILLEVEETTLRLTATDLDTGIRYVMRAKVIETGSLTVPAGILGDVVSSLPEEEISLESEESRLLVRCGKSDYTILSTPAEEFPTVPDVSDEVAFSMPQGVLKRMLRQTVFAASREESRTILMGVQFELLPATTEAGEKTCRLSVVATDTHRLAIRTAHLEGGEDKERLPKEKHSSIIPAKPLAELTRVLTDSEEDQVHIHFSESQVQFSVANPEGGTAMTLVSRVLDGQFPNYQKVIPQDHERRLTFDVREFHTALRRVAIVARENAEKVIFRTQGDIVVMTAESPEVGRAHEEVPIALEGPDIEIAFNVRYLIDALSAMESSNGVLELTEKLNPGVLKSQDDENWKYIVMPMAI